MEREALLSREERAWSDLVEAIAAVAATRREVEGVVPGWSVHDLVWHTAYWADWATDALERIRAGRPERPEPDDEEAWEAEIVATGRAMSWDQAMGDLDRNRLRAREALEAFEGSPPADALEWFTDDTIDHYREHASQVRTFTG